MKNFIENSRIRELEGQEEIKQEYKNIVYNIDEFSKIIKFMNWKIKIKYKNIVCNIEKFYYENCRIRELEDQKSNTNMSRNKNNIEIMNNRRVKDETVRFAK